MHWIFLSSGKRKRPLQLVMWFSILAGLITCYHTCNHRALFIYSLWVFYKKCLLQHLDQHVQINIPLKINEGKNIKQTKPWLVLHLTVNEWWKDTNKQQENESQPCREGLNEEKSLLLQVSIMIKLISQEKGRNTWYQLLWLISGWKNHWNKNKERRMS